MSSGGGMGSVLFQAYRSLGLISSHARPHLKLLGQERFLTVALGKGWAVYNLDKLRVVMQGGAREHTIRAIVSARDLTFTAVGAEIVVWRRQQEVHRLRAHSASVYLLYLFGSMLISVDESQVMHVWDVKALTPATSVKAQVARAIADNDEQETFISQTGEVMGPDWQPAPLATLQFPQTSRITSVLHPSTYLNKVVIGFGAPLNAPASSAQAGGLELWNIKTRAMVYRFKTDQWSAEKHNPDAMLDSALGRTSQKRTADGQVIQEALGVTCLEQTPAVDVVAVGLQSGLVLLLNLVSDTILHAYVHATPGATRGAPIAAVTFRTDEGQPLMATTATNDGSVCVWDLEKKQLRTMIKQAHGSSLAASDGTAARNSSVLDVSTPSVTIHTMYFLPNEPLLVTIGTDNALKMWIFDAADGSARLLKERSGHSAPPSKVRFYPGERGQLDVLTSGSADRSFRSFSLQKEEQSRELSQGAVEKRSKAFAGTAEAKLTAIVDVALCGTREKEWPNILTAHVNDCAGYTWKWSAKALTQHKLLNTQPGALASAVQSVAISPCGNFGLLGYQSGRVDSFHMQSGTFKASYGLNHIHETAAQSAQASSLQVKDLQAKNINLKRKAAKAAKMAGATAAAAAPVIPLNHGHTAAITGLAVDGLNRQLISCGLDGQVIFWEFRRRTVNRRVDVGAPVSRMVYSRENDLVAVMTDALVLHVLDAVTYTTVRRFTQHTAPLTDMLFSPDARWLLTASADCTVRCFDLPSSTLVDFLRFSKPVTSMAMSPAGDFLATTHVGNLGVFLWANKEHFGTNAIQSGGTRESWRARQVHRGHPLLMDVRERMGEEADEGVKKEEEDQAMEAEEEAEEDDEEESEGEEDGATQSTKRRRTSRSTRRLIIGAGAGAASTTPLLHLSEEDAFSLITYSSVPRSKWQTLAHLDEIKERNKAKVPVEKPKDAPFFLTALTSLANEKDGASAREQQQLADQFGVGVAGSTSSTAAGNAPSVGSRMVKSGGVGMRSKMLDLLAQAKVDLQSLVQAAHRSGEAIHTKVLLVEAYQPVHAYLQSLTPAGLDGELGALGLDPTLEQSEFRALLEYFLAGLEAGQQFEWVQAVMNRFLKVHGGSVAQYPELLRLCAEINVVQKRTWGRLEQAFHANLALVAHLAQIQL